MNEKLDFILNQCKTLRGMYMSIGKLWNAAYMLLPIPYVDGTWSSVLIQELPSGQLLIDDDSKISFIAGAGYTQDEIEREICLVNCKNRNRGYWDEAGGSGDEIESGGIER